MEDSRYIGVLGISNFHGIGIKQIEHGIVDYAVYELTDGDSVLSKGKVKINYSNSGEAYLTIKGKRYYLKNFMQNV